MRLDLADEDHAIVLGDAEIGGFAGLLHQLLHDRSCAVDELAAAQEGRAHAVSLDADRPELVGAVELDHAMRFKRGQHAIGGGGGQAASRRDFAQRQAIAFGDDGEDAQARSSDCTELSSAGALKERGRPRWRFSVVSMLSRADATEKIKNIFDIWNIANAEKRK